MKGVGDKSRKETRMHVGCFWWVVGILQEWEGAAGDIKSVGSAREATFENLLEHAYVYVKRPV